MESDKGISTSVQIVLIYILIGPLLALGLLATFIGSPKFLEPFNQKLSLVGGSGPLLIFSAVIIFVFVVYLNRNTDEDKEIDSIIATG